MKVFATDPTTPEAECVLAHSCAFLEARFPPERRFRLGVKDLGAQNVTFFLAEEEGMAVGCAAFVHQCEEWGQLKSMYVAPAARGSGAARLLLDAVEDRARAAGVTRLRVETCTGLEAAEQFYVRNGFDEVGLVASGADGQPCTVYEKDLAPELVGAEVAAR